VPGVKNAAVRKLQHELGIPSNQLDVDRMKFLTRLHYWASDTVTHGPNSVWGEHEIDYVLFLTINNTSEMTISPNPEEIDEIKWVSPSDLECMLNESTNLFSPWFRILYFKWMKDNWWNNLHVTMTTDKYVDYVTIHRFDPPAEHFGGGGNAVPMFTTIQQEDVGDKRYGKFQILLQSGQFRRMSNS
jgi:NUDIX domain